MSKMVWAGVALVLGLVLLVVILALLAYYFLAGSGSTHLDGCSEGTYPGGRPEETYPSFLWQGGLPAVETYPGGRPEGTYPGGRPEGTYPNEIGLPESLPIEIPAVDYSSATLYFFESPRCPHCISFQDTWSQLISEYPQIQSVKVDTSDHAQQRITLYYNVTSVPTIILVTRNEIYEYQGDRSMQSLREFLEQRI